MTPIEAIVLIGCQVLTLATAIVSYLQSLKNTSAISEVHLLMNSRLSELLAVTRASAHAAGRLEGVESAHETAPTPHS